MQQQAAKALEWLAQMGVDEAIAAAPVNRFAESAALMAAAPTARQQSDAPVARRALNHQPATGTPAQALPAAPLRQPAAAAPSLPTEQLIAMAQGCKSLDQLARFLDDFEACPLKRTATRLCFADGLPGAHVMIVGEAPGRDEDEQGLPFVGRSGQLLDKMLAAIGLDRRSDDPARSVFITNTVFWRPPGNRNPSGAELAMCLPFVHRAIELCRPRLVLSAGNIPTQALLQTSQGITRLRGNVQQINIAGRDISLMPTYHPSFLLRAPESKRLAWRDLLAVKEILEIQ